MKIYEKPSIEFIIMKDDIIATSGWGVDNEQQLPWQSLSFDDETFFP